MPIYEYVCSSCGQQSEIMHRMSDPPATECPSCHANTLVKQISAAGFRLKGGGWYETDFKSNGKRNVAGDAGAGDGAGSSSSPSKPDGESKPGESKPSASAAGASGCATPSASKPASPPAT